MALAQDGSPSRDTPSIIVDGSASAEVTPDLAFVTLGVSTARPLAGDAASDNNAAAAAMLDQVRSEGIAAADIQTSQTSLTPVFDQRDGAKIKGFTASNRIILRLRDLPKVGGIIGRLVGKGANNLEGVEFVVEHPEAMLDKLRADATRDAFSKARVYTGAAGVKLGRILQIMPESASPAPVFRAMKSTAAASDAASVPLSPGTQTLEARVRISWEITP
nr:SIMPL domain-containing protein [Lichenifustis flavocetrariae]